MTTHARRSTLTFGVLALLAGCASTPPIDPTAERPHCDKSNRGRVVVCTSSPSPSLLRDADAKRFAADPGALTVFVVRRNWGDGPTIVRIFPDAGRGIETLPNTFVRLTLKPGAHDLAFETGQERRSVRIEGGPGERRFVRLESLVWAWGGSFTWTDEAEDAIRQRATKARLVADVRLL